MPTDTNSTFYVTTPIYYVNDKPHLGHVYTTMVADVVARYHRLRGDDTFFLTGVDEHAAKVSDKAAEHGLSPQEWADQNAAAFRGTFEKLEMTNDDFVRTSEDRHKQRVTEYIAALMESGDVYPGEYEGWYDAGQEEYVPEGKAKDQDFKSAVNGKPLVRKKEKNYFFRLSSYRDELLKFYEERDSEGTAFVQPAARKKEVINRIKEAMDVPISRTGSGGWGIPMPGDPEQTIWVWFDALFNYLTYVDTDDRRHYWQAGATHFIAKDILWFHAAIWPALLLALRKCEGYKDWHGQGPLALPKTVYSHSYWVSESGEKMSKSLGNFLDPAAIDNYQAEIEAGAKRTLAQQRSKQEKRVVAPDEIELEPGLGLNALRFFLATKGPLGTTDSTFSADLFIETYNSELANTFGNSCSRVSNMVEKYFEGKLPPQSGTALDSAGMHGDFSKGASEWLRLYLQNATKLDLSRTELDGMSPVDDVNVYIDELRPFTLAKDPANLPEVGTILYNCAEALRIASVLLWPFIPDKCEQFWSRIGFGHYAEQLKDGGRGDLAEWVKWGQLVPGTPIEKGEALFPRYQVEKK